jgi:outer membrane protein assembly factor BamB
MIFRRRFLLAVLCLITGPAVQAGDWPEFRGPTGQGIVPHGSLPVEWSETKNVVWKQPIPGAGWSSPVIAGGRIFLTTSVPVKDGAFADQSLRTLALDAAKGKILWDKEVFLQIEAGGALVAEVDVQPPAADHRCGAGMAVLAVDGRRLRAFLPEDLGVPDRLSGLGIQAQGAKRLIATSFHLDGRG